MKPLLFGVFENAQANDSGTATWRHEKNERIHFDRLDYWTNLARICEEADLDWLFLADAWGWSEIDGVRPEICDIETLDLPRLDPAIVVAAIIHATRRLGLVITGSTFVEAPYSFARRIATLDHLAEGRIGWNVVTTGTAETAASAFGKSMINHDERYNMADDFMELAYKLFESAWEFDAVERDREGHFSNPVKVHRIEHDGPYFKCDGYGNTHYSPQGTPVIFQAGSSSRGLEFAARHGECIFLGGGGVDYVAEQVQSIRQKAKRNGRNPKTDIKIICAISCVVGETEEAAESRYQSILKVQRPEVAAASYAMFTGIDLSKHSIETKMSDLQTELSQSQIQRFGEAKVGDVLKNWHANGVRPIPYVGTAELIANALLEMASKCDLDGFMLVPVVQPLSTIEFVEQVLPLLRSEPVKPKAPLILTLRERLLGAASSVLSDSHPGAVRRGS